MLSEQIYTERLEYAKTHTPEEFARMYGLKANSAIAFYYSHRISVPKKKNINISQLCEYAKTHTKEETAGHFGICTRTLARYEKKYGFKCKKNSSLLNERNLGIYEYSETHTMRETGEKYGITKQRVSKIRGLINEKKKNTTC